MMSRLQSITRSISSLEIWIAALVVFLSMAATWLLPLALGVMLCFWLIRWLGSGFLSQRTPVDWGIALLVLLLPVTLWISALPETTKTQVLRLLTGIAFFYAIVNWANTSLRLRWILVGVITAGLILAAGAFFSVDWAVYKLPFIPKDVYERFSLLVSDTVNANVMAGSLAILLPIAPALLLFAWREIHGLLRLALALVTVGMTVVLVLTQSRSAMIALLAVFLVFPLLRWRWAWFVEFAILSSLIFVFIFRREDSWLVLINRYIYIDIFNRIEIWSRAVMMLRDFPFTGIGMGSFREVADHIYPFLQNGPGRINHAHNLFLQVAVDLGIPGFIAWLSVLLNVIFVSWKTYLQAKQSKNNWFVALGAGMLLCQLALIIHGLTDAVTWGMVRPAPLVWAIWGLAFAVGNLWARDFSDRPSLKPMISS
jgi:putative inorganic carbon (HCO3(-)) transporter